MCYIFDINTILKIKTNPHFVDKNEPNKSLLKINNTDFKLIKDGLYKNQNNKIEFNDIIYWIPTNIYNQLKIIAKNKNIDISNIVISMCDIINKENITEKDYIIDLTEISKYENKDIFLISSTNTEKNFKPYKEHLINTLKNNNIEIKKIYYLNNTLFNHKKDVLLYQKSLICLQQLTGYIIENDKFIDKQIEKYSKVYLFDNDLNILNIIEHINSFLTKILSNTNQGLKEVIKENLIDDKSILIINKMTCNKYNPYITKNIKIKYQNIIQNFESFVYSKINKK